MMPSIESLLERAGADLSRASSSRTNRSVDCPRCGGRRDLSYSDDAFHCFRCLWSGNRRTLARELGLDAAEPKTEDDKLDAIKSRRSFSAEQRSRSLAGMFRAWRDRELRRASDWLYAKGRKAELARRVLASYSEDALAWDALAEFYHGERAAMARFDLLVGARTSAWLDGVATSERLVEEWRRR